MTTAGIAAPGCPVNDDEAQAHYHEEESKSSEAGSLEIRSRIRDKEAILILQTKSNVDIFTTLNSKV